MAINLDGSGNPRRVKYNDIDTNKVVLNNSTVWAKNDPLEIKVTAPAYASFGMVVNRNTAGDPSGSTGEIANITEVKSVYENGSRYCNTDNTGYYGDSLDVKIKNLEIGYYFSNEFSYTKEKSTTAVVDANSFYSVNNNDFAVASTDVEIKKGGIAKRHSDAAYELHGIEYVSAKLESHKPGSSETVTIEGEEEFTTKAGDWINFSLRTDSCHYFKLSNQYGSYYPSDTYTYTKSLSGNEENTYISYPSMVESKLQNPVVRDRGYYYTGSYNRRTRHNTWTVYNPAMAPITCITDDKKFTLNGLATSDVQDHASLVGDGTGRPLTITTRFESTCGAVEVQDTVGRWEQ